MLKRFFSQVGGDSMLKYFPRFFATTKIGGLTGDLKFNFEHHQWFFQYEKQGKKYIRIGVTEEAVRKMDGVTHIEWEEARDFQQDEALVQLESCKGTFPINAPFDCRLLRNNQETLSLENDFEALKTSSQDEGWILEIESNKDISQLQDLIDEKEYNEKIAIDD